MARPAGEITPADAARQYQAGLAAARRAPLPSTGETRTQLGSARTAGNAAAGTAAR
ncbi:hypothetical protein ACH4N4_05195 [Streptomyces microflavus]|uniref:hypothetical protein n=1 Tax=Streptomyces microflavus TaxID=1919 RepID=UPI00378CFA6C